MRDDSPVSPIPAIWAPMQRIRASRGVIGRILIGKNMVGLSIDHETAILDAVRVATWNAAEMRMLTVLLRSAMSLPHFTHTLKITSQLPINQMDSEMMRTYNPIITSVIKARNDIPLDTARIINKQIRDTRSIGNESGADAYSLNDIFAIAVWARARSSNCRVARCARQRLTRDLWACKNRAAPEECSESCRRCAHPV
jgi:hypothetical protein